MYTFCHHLALHYARPSCREIAQLQDLGLHGDDPVGGPVPCSGVVIAAGAWSKRLAAMLGTRALLDTERGYHLTLPHAGAELRLPVYSTERGFVCTPLEHGLRIAGTVELEIGRANV